MSMVCRDSVCLSRVCDSTYCVFVRVLVFHMSFMCTVPIQNNSKTITKHFMKILTLTPKVKEYL